jgi:hypothetical protein
LQGGQNGAELGGGAERDAIIEDDVAFGRSEGLELEVGNDAEGGTGTAEGPEEICVLRSGCGDDAAVRQDDLGFEDVIQS